MLILVDQRIPSCLTTAAPRSVSSSWHFLSCSLRPDAVQRLGLAQLRRRQPAQPAAILAASPQLAVVTASIFAFATIMNARQGRKLLVPRMTAAMASGERAFRSFVADLRADEDAFYQCLRRSSGAV